MPTCVEKKNRGPKGTHLYSNYDCVGELYVPLPNVQWEAELVTKLLATKHIRVGCISLEATLLHL